MKRVHIILVAFIFVLGFSAIDQAQADPGEKLKKGTCQLIGAPLELGKRMVVQMDKTDFAPLGVVAGVLDGVGQTMEQGIRGFVNILTFAFDNPDC